MKKLYRKLLKRHGPKKDWWPISGVFSPSQLEVCIGAILTQNTNWRNVEKSLRNMEAAGITTTEKILECNIRKLQKVIKTSGFYKSKSICIKALCKLMISKKNFYNDATREELLGIKGIGRETADAILLYACNKPFFVVDAYTKKLLQRERMIKGNEKYDDIRKMFESRLSTDADLYKEFHALIVENGKLVD